MRVLLAVFGIMLTASAAQAAVVLKDVVLQQGYFRDLSADCKLPEPSAVWDECGCEADMIYPQVASGINHPLIESRVNTRLQFLAPKRRCDGVVAEAPDGDRNPNQYTSKHTVMTNNDHYLSVVQDTYSYGAGAAHGMEVRDAVTMQMPEGKPLSLAMILDETRTAELNAYLYDAIVERAYEGELDPESYWGKALASKKDRFITRNACEECVFYLDNEGLKLSFQLYSVAAYAAGIIEIPVPAEFVGDAALKAYLEKR